MRAAAMIALALLAGPASVWAQVLPTRAAPLHVLGYAEFGYLETERPDSDGFLGGRLVGEVTYELADGWAVFGDLDAAADPDRFDVSVESLELRFAPREALSLALGRFRTPITYWDTEFSRGAWARTTVDRPLPVGGQGGLLPLYAVGLRVGGRITPGPLELGYVAGLANGRDRDIRLPGDAGDADGHHAWMLALHARPLAGSGLRVGGAVYRDRPVAAAGPAVDERIVTAHVAWERESPELIAEYSHIRHRAAGLDAAHVGRAYYAQLAYRLPGRLLGVKPYLRVERVDPAAGDPLYTPEDLRHRGAIVGVRYDFTRAGALKAEYRTERAGGGDRFASLHLQASVRLAAPEPPVVRVAGPPAVAPVVAPDTAGRDTAAAPAKGAPAENRPAGRAAPERRRVEPVAIVVHPDTRVDDLSLPELRRIFRGEQQLWPDDERVVLLVRSPLPAERDVVLGRIYQMDEVQFRQLWLAKIFRSTATSGPKMVADIDTARRLLAALPGAISFMPAAEVGPGLRVVRIDGKLPGEAGYPLQ